MPVKDNEAQVNQRRDQSRSKKNPFVLTVKQRNYERSEAEHDVNLMLTNCASRRIIKIQRAALPIYGYALE